MALDPTRLRVLADSMTRGASRVDADLHSFRDYLAPCAAELDGE